MDTPQKYIRTFAGDMATVKSGGAPDLVPFPEQKKQPTFSTPQPQLAQALAPEVVPPPEETIPTVQKGIPAKTYAGDFTDRVKETGASTSTVLAVEQDAHVAPAVVEPEPVITKSNRAYLIGGVVLFVLALGGTYVTYARYTSLSLPVPLLTSAVAPIIVEEQNDVSGEGKELLQQIQQLVARPLSVGSVRLLNLAQPTTASVFGSLPLSAPGVLLRNIESTTSVAGVINAGEASPFFILRVSSFGETFSGMLQWEAHMARDLKELFPARPVLAVVATTTATTTKEVLEPQATQQPAFIDKTVANHDVRILLDAQNREIILYGYWNQRTLVIARDSASFTELLRRLASSRVYR